jgi:hypothetical protein
MGNNRLQGKKICWTAVAEDSVYAKGEIAIPDGFFGLGRVGEISFTIPEENAPKKISLTLIADNIREENNYLPKNTCNSYDLWAYPHVSDASGLIGKSVKNGTTVYVTENPAEAEQLLKQGERVIYLPYELKENIEGFYCTDFWCYPMFRTISESMNKPVPVGTMGLLIDNAHPALKNFPCEKYSTPQWYNIVSHAECAVLDDTPSDFRPIVQMIDNFERNHKLGILYEAKSGKGKILVCTCRLSEISEKPEIQAFAMSLLEYAHSDDFNPEYELKPTLLGLEREEK